MNETGTKMQSNFYYKITIRGTETETRVPSTIKIDRLNNCRSKA